MSKTLSNVGVVEGDGVDPSIIDPTNYADSKKHVQRFEQEIWGLYGDAKDRRSQLDQDWTRYINIWRGTHTIRYYDGQADLKIRMGRKVIDTLVAQTKGLVWPNAQLFKVFGNSPIAEQKIPQIEALIDHDVEQAKLRDLTELFLSTGLVYGFSVLKTWWKVQSTTNYRRQTTNSGQVFFGPKELYTYEGPKTEVVDPFRFYVWPLTARNLEDATAIFEDMEVPKSHLKSMAGREVFSPKHVKDVLAGSGTPMASPGRNITVDDNRDQRSRADGFSVSETTAVKDNRFRLTEVWFNWELDGEHEVACKATVVNGTIVELRQNPFFIQKPPYDMWRVTDLMDNVYGQGKMALIEDLQYAVDALVNQGLDTLNFQINPVILADEDLVDLEELKIRPRAVWPVQGAQGGVEQAVAMLRPPDYAGSAFNAMGLVLGLLQDIGAAPPVLQGKTGNKESTATEISAIAQGANSFTTTMASKIESQVLSPLLQRYYQLEEQFRSNASLARITGQLKQPVDPQDLVGDYSFIWEVSTEAAQAMQLQQVNGGTTAVPAGAESGAQGDLLSLVNGLEGGEG